MDGSFAIRDGIVATALLALFVAAHRCDAQPGIAPTIPWRIHDTTRTQPVVVDPGPYAPASRAPSDAIVLFDGRDASEWRSRDGAQPSRWKIENGYIEVVGGAGGISTAREFG